MSTCTFIRGNAARRRLCLARSAAGFTLIELMVAMLLGLIVIAGVTSVFLAGQRSYRTNVALGDVQDSSRVAFELMARDIRDAGLTGCDNSGRVANVLTASPTGGGTAQWWADWSNALHGYIGTATDPANTIGTASTNRVSGQPSLILLGAEGTGYSVKSDSEPTGTFTLNETSTDLQTGDVVIVCTPDHATITQINSVTSGSPVTFNHAKTGNPGNCTTDLSYPTVCSSTSSYVFTANSQVAKLDAADWYIGYYTATDGTTGTSLYRVALSNDSGVPTATPQEMVRNVTGMALSYHQSGGSTFVTADSVTSWGTVDAVKATLTVESTDQRAGTDAKAITREFTMTTTVRNRVP